MRTNKSTTEIRFKMMKDKDSDPSVKLSVETSLSFIPFFCLKAKQVELQFTVGEAITRAAIGTSSGAARDPWTCTEEQYSPPQSTRFSRSS